MMDGRWQWFKILTFLIVTIRMGGKVLEEAVLSETREGGGTEELADSTDMPSRTHKGWRKMHWSLNSIVGPSTMKSDGDKGIYPQCKDCGVICKEKQMEPGVQSQTEFLTKSPKFSPAKFD